MKKLYQKILAGILCSMLFLSAVTVQAAQVNNGAVYSISTNEIAEGKSVIARRNGLCIFNS